MGLRVAELCNLILGDIEFTDRKGKVHVIGKGEKERDIPLNLPARNAVLEWFAIRPEVESDGLFSGRKYMPLTINSVERIVRDLG